MGESSDRTRQALGEALMAALESAPLNRVTVRGLTEATGITRQAFYYHFADVYDLAVWTFKNSVSAQVMPHASHAEWSLGLRLLLTWMSEHRSQTYQTIAALNPGDFEIFLHAQFRAVMKAVVSDLQAARPELRVSDHDRAFIINHYTASVLGHVLHWLATDMREDPQDLTTQIQRILKGCVTRSLEEFAEPSPMI